MALIAAARDAAGRVRDGIAGSVATGGEALDRLGAAGIGGSAAGAETMRAVELLGEALSEAEHLDGHLEKCRFIAMSAITGLYSNGTGGYTVPKSGTQTDDPTTWERPTDGGELTDPERKRRSRLDRAMRSMSKNADDLQKSTKDVTNQTAKIFRDFKGPDPAQTVTHTAVPDPVVQPQMKTPHGDIVSSVLFTGVTAVLGVVELRKRRRRKRDDEQT
ncbi:hypothetical protein [Stackebrandtia albiflava]|uniref:hypothetical protein n=1 Tax=Stackebrandtia albiflava TaxID=406432 RepID=UPI0011BF2D05|nr:hypothetical protein [Stackebrandtia albiflava]